MTQTDDQWPFGDGEMAGRIRAHDWSATLLGPVAGWSERLKVLVEQVLASPLVSTLACAPEQLLIYNDAAARQFGDRHPAALGRPLPDTFPEGWATVAPYYVRAFAGETVQVRGEHLDTRGEGAATDVFDALLTPIRDSDERVAYVHMTGAEVADRARIEAALRDSETRHRLLIERWAQAVWETDAQGVVVADSPGWRAYTGQTLEEWLGYGWLNAIHPDDRVYAEKQWRDAIAARGLVDAEFRLRAPNGGWRWTNVRAAPVLDAAGNIDIDARKRAEAAVRASEEKYRGLFWSMDEAYAVVEVLKDGAGKWVDFRFLDANRAFMRHTSMPYPVGKTATELLGSPNPRWTELYGHALDTGEPIRIEETEHTLGRTFDLNIFSLDRAQDQVAVLFTDITARKHAECLLRESEERQAYLLGLADALRPLATPTDVAALATTSLGEQLKASRVHYGYITGMRLRVERDHTRGVPSIVGEHPLELLGPEFLATYEAGVIVESTDVMRDVRFGADARAAFAERQIGAFADLVLFEEGQRVGVLAAQSAGPRDWTQAEKSLIREVGERVKVAIERSRAETALRESEERQAFLLKLSDALRPFDDPAVIQETASRLLAEHLGVNRAMYSEFEGEGEHRLAFIRGQYVRDGTPFPSPVPYAVFIEGPAGDTLKAGEALIVEDAASETRFGAAPRDAWLPAGIAAMIAVGLVKDAREVAHFGVHSDTPRTWSTADVALIREVAERTWAAGERARAEAAQRESEERFQQFASASAAGLWIRDADTLAMEFVSPAIGMIYGVEPDELLGDVKRWAATVVPEDRETAIHHLEAARRGEVAIHEFRIGRPSDGAFRWIRNTDFPLYDDGRIPRIGGIAEDVTEAKLAGEHTGVLLAELQHRVRNIMGMIRSMANRTELGASAVTDYRLLLEGRLLALARVQALLTREANAGGSLRSIIESEIAAQAHHGGQYALTGPDIQLSPKAVEVLTLAFHELATNALKYGALTVPEGRLSVSWTLIEKRSRPWLALDWIEEGAPSREPSTRRGFGSELIESRIPYELGGKGKIAVGPEGARCHLEFPLQEGESILETDAPQPATIFGGTLDMTGAPDLTGRTVLVVEDDYYMANDTAAALRGAGAEVLGPCPSEDKVRDLLEDETPTHAVLDLNLGGGGPRFEIAHMLKARGVPFVFLTGYDPGVIPPDMADVARLQKPLPFRDIVEAVGQL